MKIEFLYYFVIKLGLVCLVYSVLYVQGLGEVIFLFKMNNLVIMYKFIVDLVVIVYNDMVYLYIGYDEVE